MCNYCLETVENYTFANQFALLAQMENNLMKKLYLKAQSNGRALSQNRLINILKEKFLKTSYSYSCPLEQKNSGQLVKVSRMINY